MSFYKDKHKANVMTEKMIASLRTSKQEGKVSNIILEITRRFPVSDKTVMQRLELIALTDEGMILEGDLIQWR